MEGGEEEEETQETEGGVAEERGERKRTVELGRVLVGGFKVGPGGGDEVVEAVEEEGQEGEEVEEESHRGRRGDEEVPGSCRERTKRKAEVGVDHFSSKT